MPARRRSTARKSAKAASTPVIKSTPTVNRPEKPNLSLEDYKADFKVRWQIHTYEVNELASDVKKAYRKLAMIHHPDKGGTEDKFKEKNNAFETMHIKINNALFNAYWKPIMHFKMHFQMHLE